MLHSHYTTLSLLTLSFSFGSLPIRRCPSNPRSRTCLTPPTPSIVPLPIPNGPYLSTPLSNRTRLSNVPTNDTFLGRIVRCLTHETSSNRHTTRSLGRVTKVGAADKSVEVASRNRSAGLSAVGRVVVIFSGRYFCPGLLRAILSALKCLRFLSKPEILFSQGGVP